MTWSRSGREHIPMHDKKNIDNSVTIGSTTVFLPSGFVMSKEDAEGIVAGMGHQEREAAIAQFIGDGWENVRQDVSAADIERFLVTFLMVGMAHIDDGHYCFDSSSE